MKPRSTSSCINARWKPRQCEVDVAFQDRAEKHLVELIEDHQRQEFWSVRAPSLDIKARSMGDPEIRHILVCEAESFINLQIAARSEWHSLPVSQVLYLISIRFVMFGSIYPAASRLCGAVIPRCHTGVGLRPMCLSPLSTMSEKGATMVMGGAIAPSSWIHVVSIDTSLTRL